jgi:hypothetical protein
MLYAASGSGSSIATWTFTVAPGVYRIAATWSAHPNRATNSPFTILDGTTQVTSVPINQELTPNDFSASGATWETLAASVTITTGTIVVRLTNSANEYVIADAVRIEKIG